MNKSITILIVADNEIVRQGLRKMLQPMEELEVVGDCASTVEAISKIAGLHPDIVLLDKNMLGTNEIEAIRRLKRKEFAYDSYIIILAESLDRRGEALNGVASYLLKNITAAELAEVVRQVYRDRREAMEAMEAVELVISPPSNADQLFRYIGKLEKLLYDDSGSIVSVGGSWARGVVITVQLEPAKASSLPIKLAGIPEVEKVEEQPLTGGTLASKLKLRIRPSKRFSVTLREGSYER